MPEFRLFTGEQVRAGRAMARIEQSVLAERSGVSLETIKRIEGVHGVVEVNARTYSAILGAFERLGIHFESYGGDHFGVRRSSGRGAAGGAAGARQPAVVPAAGPAVAAQSAEQPRAAALGQLRRAADGQASTLLAYWDHDLKCRFANEGYLEWFGRSPAEMIGLAFQDLLGPALFATNETFLRAALAGEPQTFERTMRKPSGAVGHTLVQYFPDIDGDGRVLGVRAVVTDVTRLKEAELSLASAKAVFEAARRQADAVVQVGSQTLAAFTLGTGSARKASAG
ncbi:MAG: PAS domain-containing protein [Phenylobacterium sp.]